MRDKTRQIMKARLDQMQAEYDALGTQISGAQARRQELKAERDEIKADLDAAPEGTPTKS